VTSIVDLTVVANAASSGRR